MAEELLWIERIKKGETEHFDALYHKYAKRLFGLCLQFTHSPQDAEEQQQEIFMKVLRKIGQFNGDSAFSSWLYRLAVNHLINFQKRRARIDAEVDLPHDDEHAGPKTDDHLRMMLQAALRELPEGFRKVFILHDQLGFQHEEIAEILGCSAGNSRSQLSRSRLALREKLKPLLRRSSYAQA